MEALGALGPVARGGELVLRGVGQPDRRVRLDALPGGCPGGRPRGDPIAETGTEPGLAVASADVSAEVEHARKALSPIRDLRPEAYLEARPMTAA